MPIGINFQRAGFLFYSFFIVQSFAVDLNGNIYGSRGVFHFNGDLISRANVMLCLIPLRAH